jgi:3-keto-5-aminohexanoate cleavage enzyme
MNKVIINFTPTGMIPMKADTPYVPVSVQEIVNEVKAAVDLGITMVHLHARDDQGLPTSDKETFAQIIQGIREFAPELILCVSTSGRIHNDFETRSQVLLLEGPLKPDMASLTLSSLNFNKTASISTPDTILSLAKLMKEKGIKVELEVFDLGMANMIKYLIKKELIQEPYYVNLILGNIATAQTDLLSIGVLINDLPEDAFVSLGAVGNDQLKANALAIACGYGVRVGLEDNYWYDQERTVLATNISLLKRIHTLIDAHQKTVMTSKELRAKLHLNPGHGHYGFDPK